VTVTWGTAGAQSVSVNYTNTNLCTALTPSILPVNVVTIVTPALTGLNTVCSGITGVVYATDAGQSSYIWTISSGGTITSGGTSTSNTATVTWNIAGAQSISVTYTATSGCTANVATLPVTVDPLPVPTITGLSPVCVGSTGVTYTTEASMTGYTWTVSGGGTITGGSTTNVITVTWNTAGARTVTVNYTNVNGCTASSATVKSVTVDPLPIPTISGSTIICVGSSGYIYTTQSGMTNYSWTVSSGGTITSGGTATNNTVTVTWNTVGAQTVSVNYTNGNSCTAVSPTIYPVTVNPLPIPSLTGTSSVCSGATGVVYTTDAGMTNYVWFVSSGGTITSGGGSGNNTVTVTWNSAGAQSVGVNYQNTFGCYASSPTSLPVAVKLAPLPTISGPSTICAISTGNVYTTEIGMTNYVWTVSGGGTITAGGGINDLCDSLDA